MQLMHSKKGGILLAIVLLRTIFVFACLILSMRLMGKRQLGELELSEFIVAVLISDVAAQTLQDISVPLVNALLPMLTLFCCELLISGITLRNPKLRMIMFGKPSILIKDGKIDQAAMKSNRVSIDELAESMRSNGVTDLSKVRYAILETDGEINTVLYASAQPLTPESQFEASPDTGIPHVIINDGRIMDNNLKLVGRDHRWLNAELKKRHLASAKDVYYMSVDDAGCIYFAAKEF